MGGDIAAWCALRGLTRHAAGSRAEDTSSPRSSARRNSSRSALRDPRQGRGETTARLTADVEGAGVARADVVIEAIFENADAKRELYARLEPRMKPGALLATNTSSIVLETLAQRARATRAGSSACTSSIPVAQMPLVEVIQSRDRRTPTSCDAALAFTRAIDKLPLPCRSAPGFLVNRVLMPYLTEAMLVAQEGVPLALIDRGRRVVRHADGPDRARGHRGPRRLPARRQDPRSGVRPPGSRRARPRWSRPGKLGRKSGEGFYEWRDGKAVKPPAAGARAATTSTIA